MTNKQYNEFRNFVNFTYEQEQLLNLDFILDFDEKNEIEEELLRRITIIEINIRKLKEIKNNIQKYIEYKL